MEKKDELKYLLDKLDFSSDSTVAAAMEQPRLFLRAAEYRIEALHSLNQSEAKKDSVQADVAGKIRRHYREQGEKLTEAMVTELLVQDSVYSKAVAEADVAKERDEYSRLLLEAFRMRAASIKVVADLTNAEVAVAKLREAGTEQLQRQKARLKEKYPGR